MQFIDIAAQQRRLKPAIDTAIADVLAHGQYVLGPEVGMFESELAAFAGAKHAVGCANGTDAILLPLMAWGVGPGDAVFCPSFTYCATAEVVALAGATPVFVDVERSTYNMDAGSLARAVAEVRQRGELVPRAVIAVDLFGQSADYPALSEVTREHGLKLVSDCAQGFGTTLDGHGPLHWADVQTTSFFPAKPLGAYGDGGAVLLDDGDMDGVLRSLRMHGAGETKYDNVRVGLNSRLDTLQAAILRPKLEVFADEIERRGRIAERYNSELKGIVERVPHVSSGVVSTWAQYTVEVAEPDALQAALRERGVPSARYYPVPIHRQTAYQGCPIGGNGLPNTESAMERVISLPMHAYLEPGDQDRVVEAVRDSLRRC